MANFYTHQFVADCPNNGDRIVYRLVIESDRMIEVESIEAVCSALDEGFHERIADRLLEEFGGLQTLEAQHCGVHIKTVRP